MKLVVVDDDTLYVRSAKRLLRRDRATADVEFFGQAEAAIAYLASSPPAVVVLDLKMPGVDGISACRQIKAAVPTHSVIVVSGFVTPELREAAHAAGADRVLQKPCDLRAIIDSLASGELRPVGSSNMLSSDHIAIANSIARRLARRYGTLLPKDDIDGFALLGLCEAANRYNPACDGPFLPFATRRIKGAVLDELRRLDVPEELVAARDDVTPIDTVISEAPSAEVVIDDRIVLGLLDSARRLLSSADAELIALRFEQDMSIAAIARKLNTTESRVSTRLARCVARISAAIRDDDA